MLTTILTALGGGLLRLLPELLALFNKKTDNAHELAMLDKQLALENVRGANRTAEIGQQHAAAMGEAELRGSIDLSLKSLGLHGEALRGQMQKTGIKIVDALNFAVRPLTTYYFLGCYGIYKTAMLVAAFQQHDVWTAILQSYDADDRAILAGLIAFWFVGRPIEKK
jgi:hypothetical protein